MRMAMYLMDCDELVEAARSPSDSQPNLTPLRARIGQRHARVRPASTQMINCIALLTGRLIKIHSLMHLLCGLQSSISENNERAQPRDGRSPTSVASPSPAGQVQTSGGEGTRSACVKSDIVVSYEVSCCRERGFPTCDGRLSPHFTRSRPRRRLCYQPVAAISVAVHK